MDDFSIIKNTLISIQQHASMITNSPNESNFNNILKIFNIRILDEKYNKIISIEVANYLKLENNILNKYIEKVAKELHLKIEKLHKVNSVNPEADAYYIYLD